jgi:arylsulfatase A-like enzyme
MPVLQGGNLPERTLFWHYPHYGNQGGAPTAAVRRGDWKLIEWMEDGRVELFNLAQDVSEKNDLASAEPERTAQMLAELRTFQQDVQARLPTPNPNFRSDQPSGRAARSPKAKAGKKGGS